MFSKKTVVEQTSIVIIYTTIIVVITILLTSGDNSKEQDENYSKIVELNSKLTSENNDLKQQNASLLSDISAMSEELKTHKSGEPSITMMPSERTNQKSFENVATSKNIDISDIDSSIIEYNPDSQYVHISLKAKIKNNNDVPSHMSVKFVLLDKSGFVIDECYVSGYVRIDQSCSSIVSEKTMLKKSVYERIDVIRVEIKII